MGQGPNIGRHDRGPGSLTERAIRRRRIPPIGDIARNTNPGLATTVRKAGDKKVITVRPGKRAGSNRGKGPETIQRNTVRNKKIKNVKGVVSEKRANKESQRGKQPLSHIAPIIAQNSVRGRIGKHMAKGKLNPLKKEPR